MVTMSQLVIRIPRILLRAMQIYCVKHNTSISDFIAQALQEALTRDESSC